MQKPVMKKMQNTMDDVGNATNIWVFHSNDDVHDIFITFYFAFLKFLFNLWYVSFLRLHYAWAHHQKKIYDQVCLLPMGVKLWLTKNVFHVERCQC